MPVPSIVSTPINLRTTGTSIFWLNASSVSVNDTVKVVRTVPGAGYWEGSIDSKHPNNPKGLKAKVTFNAGVPPLPAGTKKSKKVYSAGDIIDVTITIANSPGFPDQVLID